MIHVERIRYITNEEPCDWLNYVVNCLVFNEYKPN